MNSIRTQLLTSTLVAFVMACLTGAVRAQPPDVQPMFDAGDFAGATAALEQRLAEAPDDADARLALGVTTFLSGIEEFAQTMHRYGLRDVTRLGMGMPFMNVPVRRNPNPEAVSADDVVAMLERFEEALGEVDAILEPIGDADAHMPLRIGTVRMDLNGDGELTDDESLWRFFASITQPQRRWQPEPDPEADARIREQAESFVLGLDTADAYWLRGYCHVMSGLTDLVLAYDGTELFERTGHLFFERVESPYAFLTHQGDPDQWDANVFFDAIALVHLINQPLRDAERMPAARQHFVTMIEMSRKSWRAILAETDDDNEWVPGPLQSGVIGIDLSQEQIDAWMGFLDEAEALLTGEKLLPFWRGDDDALGVNLRRVFDEPTRMDLVLWVQGTAAAPYLEQGNLTEPDFWRRLNADFGRNFPGFAFWIN